MVPSEEIFQDLAMDGCTLSESLISTSPLYSWFTARIFSNVRAAAGSSELSPPARSLYLKTVRGSFLFPSSEEQETIKAKREIYSSRFFIDQYTKFSFAEISLQHFNTLQF